MWESFDIFGQYVTPSNDCRTVHGDDLGQVLLKDSFEEAPMNVDGESFYRTEESSLGADFVQCFIEARQIALLNMPSLKTFSEGI